MADPTVWGVLPKAQDNAQTIDEAVLAAIAAHNDDPTAHMDTGQSIDVHRVNTTLDHPQSSVLADKSTASETVLNIPFQSLDGIEHSANASVVLGQGVVVDVTAGSYLVNYFYINFPGRATYGAQSGKNWLAQTAMWCDNTPGTKWRYSVGYYISTTWHGIAFFYDGSVLKAKVDLPDASYLSDEISFDMTHLHTYRIQYSNSEEMLYWFIDGVQVASFDMSAFSGGMGNAVMYEFDLGSGDETPWYFPSALLAVDNGD